MSKEFLKNLILPVTSVVCLVVGNQVFNHFSAWLGVSVWVVSFVLFATHCINIINKYEENDEDYE